MKIKPYLVPLSDTYILGPCVSLELGKTRVGLSLIFFEIGFVFDSEKVYTYGCSQCGKPGVALLNQLPPGWVKRYRPDLTYYFLCDNCRGTVEPNQDYLITDGNRARAIDEIIGQLTSQEDSDLKVKALRGYANRLLDEDGPDIYTYTRDDLSLSVAAYSDGFNDAKTLYALREKK